MSTETVKCQRCDQDAPALPGPPWPGEQGEQIAAGVCRACFSAWQPMQTKVLNELHLNLSDPAHAERLDQHMLVFFGLLDPEEAGLAASPYGFGEGGPEGKGEGEEEGSE